MSLREILFRFKEMILLRWLHWKPFAPSQLNLVVDHVNIDLVLSRCNVDWIKKTAEKTVADISVFGISVSDQSGASVPWSKFLDGCDTISVPSNRIQLRERGGLQQDVRIPWELNRLTWLLTPSAAARLGDDASANFVIRHVTDFLNSDRPGFSLRWASAIELAVQSISLLLIDSLLHDCPHWINLKDRISWALAHRRKWLSRWPSKFSSANNHRLAELVASAVIDERTGSFNPSSKVIKALRTEIRRQFLSDGFNAELSFDYHLFAIDLLAVLGVLAPRTTEELSLEQKFEQIGKTTESIWRLCGFWPSAGDSDEALVMGRIVARESVPEFLTGFFTSPKARPSSSLTLREAGYSFIPFFASTQECMLMVDHGRIGFGSLAAHGHADALGIWLHVGQVPWIIEAGTYCYQSADGRRDILRSSMMHNTISVNGRSLSTPIGPFMWNVPRCAEGKLVSLQSDPQTIEMSAAKRGQRYPIAERSIQILRDGTIRVLDTVSADQFLASHFVVGSQFREEWGTSPYSVRFTDLDGNRIQFECGQNAAISVDEVQVSPKYGHLELTHRVSVSALGKVQIKIKLDPA